MKVSVTKLRENAYTLVDQVLETGQPLTIERRGRKLLLIPEEPVSKFSHLARRPSVIKGDPDDLVDIDWSGEWRP